MKLFRDSPVVGYFNAPSTPAVSWPAGQRIAVEEDEKAAVGHGDSHVRGYTLFERRARCGLILRKPGRAGTRASVVAAPSVLPAKLVQRLVAPLDPCQARTPAKPRQLILP